MPKVSAIHSTWATDGNVWDFSCVAVNADGTYETMDGVSHLKYTLMFG